MAIKHMIRADGEGNYKTKILTARTAIQAHCHECMGFNINEIRRCSSPNCALYPFRTRDTPKGTQVCPEDAT